MITVYQWRVLEKDRRGRDRWRTLRWRMAADNAMSWAAAHAKAIEMVPGSIEVRSDHYGDGVGQCIRPSTPSVAGAIIA